MTKLKYPANPIYKTESLAKTLGFPLSKLEKLAENSDKYYKPILKPKKDGSTRTVYLIKDPLRIILKRIKISILDNVCYPDYLHGSIKGRSPATNAKIHIGATRVITLDIANFFPSVKSNDIDKICRYFFNFSAEVSNLLTKLMTHQDVLPQGSPVSPGIANLALCWDGNESNLVESLQRKDLRYSRYMDDIAVSYTKRLKREDETAIIKEVDSFIRRKGFRLKHKKTKVLSPTKPKCITGLNINKDGINIGREYTDAVFHDIKQLGKHSNEKEFASILGKINHIKQYNPKRASRLKKNLPR